MSEPVRIGDDVEAIVVRLGAARVAEEAFRTGILATTCPACVYPSEAERACMERGRVYRDEAGAIEFACRWEARIVEDADREEWPRRLRDARVPEDIARHITRGHPRHGTIGNTTAMRGVEGVLAGRSAPIVVLCGSVATGKTHAACYAIARRGGLYVRVSDLALPLPYDAEEARRIGTMTERERRAAMLRAKVLVLDDTGADRANAHARERVSETACERYDAGKITLLTANMLPEQFRARCVGEDGKAPDERLLSRLGDRAFVTCRDRNLRVIS